jgi:hypothetical protein
MQEADVASGIQKRPQITERTFIFLSPTALQNVGGEI